MRAAWLTLVIISAVLLGVGMILDMADHTPAAIYAFVIGACTSGAGVILALL